MKTLKTAGKIVPRKKRRPMARAFDLLANLPEDLASIRQGHDYPQERSSEISAKLSEANAATQRGSTMDEKKRAPRLKH